MINNINKSNKLHFFITLTITVLVIILSTCVFYSTVDKTVLAETTSESLLNFNQLVNNDHINFTASSGFTLCTNDNLDIENHYFYINCEISNGVCFGTLTDNTNFEISNGVHLLSLKRLGVWSNVDNNQVNNYQIIDLTQMYGSGNEPTLEECEKIFITTYNYTDSKIINNESFYNYTQGIIDYNKEITFDIIPQTILKNSTIFNYGEYKSSDLTTDFTNTGNLDIEVIGGFRFNLGYTISQGATLTINIAQMINTNGNLYIGYLDSNNNVLFFNYNGIDQGENLEFTFTLSQDINHLIFLSSSKVVNTDILKTNTAEAMFIGSPTILVQTTNIDNIINMIYQNAASTFNTEYYYNKGYNAGITAGKTQDTAWGNSWEFISSCFSGVGDILSIEILPNLPLYTFIAIPLLLGLIVLIYKLIGSGG